MRMGVMRSRIGCGLMLTILAVGPLVGLATAATREVAIVTGEWSWEAKAGEAPVTDRDRGPVTEIERYIFDPGVIVVSQGDTVVLRVHTLKGNQHVVEIPAFGVKPTSISRGEEKAIEFVAAKAGIFEFHCSLHHSPQTEGPMVGYIYVNPR